MSNMVEPTKLDRLSIYGEAEEEPLVTKYVVGCLKCLKKVYLLLQLSKGLR